MIKLITGDKQVFWVPLEVIWCSELIKSKLASAPDPGQGDSGEMVVVLEKISGVILEKVLTWAEHHKDNPTPEETKTWDESFMEVNQEMLFDLITASNYLGIKGLNTLTCIALAKLVKEGGSLPLCFDNLNLD